MPAKSRERNGRVEVLVIAKHPLAARYIGGVLRRAQLKFICWDGRMNRSLARGKGNWVLAVGAGVLSAPRPGLLHSIRSRLGGDAPAILIGEASLPGGLTDLARLGVQGVVTYEKLEEELGQAVRAVARGNVWISGGVLGLERRGPKNGGTWSRWSASGTAGLLTARQREVLELAGANFSNKEVSSRMNISESTVKFHSSKAFAKLGVNNRHSAAERARTLLGSSLPGGKAADTPAPLPANGG